MLGGRKAETKSKKFAHLAYLNQNSLKIQRGLKLRVCFSKVDKSWVGDFNWALPPLAIQPFFHHDHRFEQGFLLVKLVAVSFAAR